MLLQTIHFLQISRIISKKSIVLFVFYINAAKLLFVVCIKITI